MTPAELVAAAHGLGLPVLGESSLGRAITGGWLPFDGEGATSDPVLMVGGVHGNEPSSVAAVLDLCAADSRSTDGWPRVFVIPVLNPDGVLADSKDSARGVDLNRNFPSANFSATHPPGYFPGARASSEPETRILVEVVRTVQPVAVVAVHAPFACINYDGPARAWAESVAQACGWPARGDIGYPTPGSLGSWLGVDQGLPVLTIELPPGEFEMFAEPARAALRAAVQWAPGAARSRPGG